MVGSLVSQLYIHGRHSGEGSLGQIHGHGAAGEYLDSRPLKTRHQAFAKGIVLLPVRFYGFHVPVGFHIGDAHVKCPLVIGGGIPMKSNVAVACIIGYDSPGYIVQLDIVALPDHQHIISCCQQLILQYLCHGQRHLALGGSVGKGHAA